MTNLILAALTLGLAAGIKPGALGVYVIHQTMSKGLRHGFLASLAPIITDGPIILLSVFVTRELRDINWLIGAIAIAGSIYLLFVAYRIYKTPTNSKIESVEDPGHSSLIGAIKLNLLNPSPYVFWFTVGSAFIISTSTLGAWTFVICVSAALCLTKFVVAYAVKSLGDRLSFRIYNAIQRLLSIPLLIFSVQLMYSGITAWMS